MFRTFFALICALSISKGASAETSQDVDPLVIQLAFTLSLAGAVECEAQLVTLKNQAASYVEQGGTERDAALLIVEGVERYCKHLRSTEASEAFANMKNRGLVLVPNKSSDDEQFIIPDVAEQRQPSTNRRVELFSAPLKPEPQDAAPEIETDQLDGNEQSFFGFDNFELALQTDPDAARDLIERLLGGRK